MKCTGSRNRCTTSAAIRSQRKSSALCALPGECPRGCDLSNPENRRYCSEHGIRISGLPLGRPKLNPTREEKRQAAEDEPDRIEIEGVLGRGKRGFSLARVMAKRADTSETAIAIAFLVMNLETLLQILLRLLTQLRQWAVWFHRFLFVRSQVGFPAVA